jgi:hypothetical protein
MAVDPPGAAPPDPGSDPAGQEQELVQLRAELEEYQNLIDELPAIYEAKFSHQLRDVAQDIRALLDERQALQDQINRCVEGAAALPLLEAPADTPPARWVQPGRWLRRLPRGRLALAGGGGCVLAVLLLAGVLLRRGPNRPLPPPEPRPSQVVAPPPRPAPQPPEPRLRLRSKGVAWLEVRSLDDQVVFVSTLQPGEETTFPLRDGLRVRSGRPHLLEFALADQPLTVLGAANDFGWRLLRPPAPGQNPAGKPEAGEKPS